MPNRRPAVDMTKRAEELKSLKWGMFICWSLSTFSGKEWTPGVKDVAFFKASGCDTDQWARTAKEAGMGYILFLTKHHDGFCLWDTKTTDRKVTKSPLGRDVLAEVRKSCDKYGIKLALYFSEGDWTFPGARDGQGGGTGQDPAKVKAQLKELCTQYGPIEFFWMDCAAGHSGITHRELNAWVKSFQPGCFVGCNGGKPGDGTDLRAGEMAASRASAGFSGGRIHLSDPASAPGWCDVVLFAAQARQPVPAGRDDLPRVSRGHQARQHFFLGRGAQLRRQTPQDRRGNAPQGGRDDQERK